MHKRVHERDFEVEHGLEERPLARSLGRLAAREQPREEGGVCAHREGVARLGTRLTLPEPPGDGGLKPERRRGVSVCGGVPVRAPPKVGIRHEDGPTVRSALCENRAPARPLRA